MGLRFGDIEDIWKLLSEQVQLCVLRMYFGVGTLHPKTSLWFEMEMMPLVWKAKMRCVRFWLKVMSDEAYEGRLLRKIARHSVGCGKVLG